MVVGHHNDDVGASGVPLAAPREGCQRQRHGGVTHTAPHGIASKIKLKVKKTKKIKVTLPKNTASYKISFKSSNKKIVKVDSKGKVKALKKGKAKITVKTFNGKKKTIKVTVKK